MLDDDDGTNTRIKNPDTTECSRIKNPDATECPTRKCSTLTIYNNKNTNTRYSDSENNVDNNSNDNDHDSSIMYQSRLPVTYQVMHPAMYQDYFNSSVLTGSKPYTATKRNAKDDTLVYSNNKNKNSENNDDNNSYSNNYNRCAYSEDNNDNNKDGNFISSSTPPPSDSNVDNAPPGTNKKNNVRPKFISHPIGIIFRVFKQKQSKKSLAATDKRGKRTSASTENCFANEQRISACLSIAKFTTNGNNRNHTDNNAVVVSKRRATK